MRVFKLWRNSRQTPFGMEIATAWVIIYYKYHIFMPKLKGPDLNENRA